MDAQKFIEALNELEAEKGISKTSIIESLKEALRKAYVRSLGGGDDADVRVEITEDPAEISMKYVRKVVEEVEDDYLEISVEDAKKVNKKAKAGDEFAQEVPVDTLARMTALVVKSILHQKLAEAEKAALYENHKDKIGEMISGTVEKCDDRGCIVNIGRTSLFLSRKELIGDEMFAPGTPIRLYISDVSTSEKGPMIRVSRSDVGFLRRLFEEEIRDVYDGTVIIKSIAREAGIRSKVAVYSNDLNVDPVSACIGMNGAQIQKIVSQLGNGKDKEKIDIISYSPNDALFIIDAIRPATVTYIWMDEENKKAIVVVQNDQLSLAIGRKGANARVACRLTGWNIDIKEEKDMPNMDLEFKSVAEIQDEEKQRAQKEKYERYLAQVKASREEETKVEQGIEKTKPQTIVDEVLVETPKAEEPKVLDEEVKQVEETATEEVKPTVVKTTTTLESLEKALESDKKKETFKATQKTSKRPRRITEEEVENEEKEVGEEPKKVVPQMDIYTEEELKELEDEELYEDEDFDDEDVDYDEYDKYYDDDDK